jgi:lipid II:glycine glycyltransferase (peptidoglycan interpeptide bridge formation enzyme)
MEENNCLIITETDSQNDYNTAITGCFFAPLSQSWSYGEWQKLSGRVIKRYLIKSKRQIIGGFQLIQYSLSSNLNYLYVPHGPILKRELSLNENQALLNFLENIAKKESTVFLRIDTWPTTLKYSNTSWYEAPLYSYHNASFQPRFEWVLDVGQKDNELLAKMHPHSRYNIKFAEKKGIKIEKISGANLINYFPAFYALMVNTSKRNGFNLHPEAYYKNLFTIAQDKIELFFAKYGDKYLAVDLIYYENGIANWVFGGSSDEYRNLQPTFLLQWKSILRAREKGYKSYSFGGLYNSEYSSLYKDYQGITFYKKNYGGSYLNYGPAYIYSSRPFLNWLYNIRRLFKNNFK